MNREFKFAEKDIQEDENGKTKERYQVSIRISDQWIIKVYIGLSGYYRTTSYNEEIKFDIDSREIFKHTTEYIKANNTIDELSIIKELYSKLLEKIGDKISNRDYTDKYNITICRKIQSQLNRFFASIRLNFEKNYRFPNEIEGIYETNTFAVFKQLPFNLFSKTYVDGLIHKEQAFYDRLLQANGIEWFAGFVYSLRNALFHEIISPLDEDWQSIFKSAYLILKKISDICIDTVYGIFSLNEIDDNPIVEFVMNNPVECVNRLADHVEVLEVSKISLTHFELNNPLITASGILKLKVKLQNGEANDVKEETGEIRSEEPVVISFEAKMDDNLEIANSNDGQKVIELSIAGT